MKQFIKSFLRKNKFIEALAYILQNNKFLNSSGDGEFDKDVDGIFEYAISNKPIIIGSKGDAKNFIEKYNFGIVVAPSNKIAFKKAILEVTNGNYNFLPKTDKFISDYSIENILDKYENIINNSHKG